MTIRMDRTISKVAGINNYMDQLAIITGNIHSITPDYYMEKLSQIDKMNHVICTELTGLELYNLVKSIETEYNKLNLLNPYIEKKHKKSTKVSKKLILRPEDIYKSGWFKIFKSINGKCMDMFVQFEIDAASMGDKQKNIIKENPQTVETFKFYDVAMNTDRAYRCVYTCKKFIDRIIEIILTPMYDTKEFIKKHWDMRIDNVIGTQLKEKIKDHEKHEVATEDIQRYVYIFVLSKYRLEVTGSPDQFAKVLMKSISEYDLAGIDASKFVQVIDGIDFDQVQNNKHIKDMAAIAKDEIIKISKNENISAREIMEDIDKFLSIGDDIKDDEDKKQPKEIKDAEKIVDEQEDVFA